MSKPLTTVQKIAYRAIRFLEGAASPSEVAHTINRIERRFGFK